ncbi:uncharacterized protein LOC119328552 [Triticum dicoccoides]|uniref:uncharacterized protein LOC119328552 n=1 Tax=Triticum dicoccoides TaxID=85692 RepID=UPI0018910A00|nr:uncharacterized protein LOC119328552 [Triticum dicoccoides]
MIHFFGSSTPSSCPSSPSGDVASRLTYSGRRPAATARPTASHGVAAAAQGVGLRAAPHDPDASSSSYHVAPSGTSATTYGGEGGDRDAGGGARGEVEAAVGQLQASTLVVGLQSDSMTRASSTCR